MLLPLLRARVTPEAFDGTRSVTEAEAATLVNAFRWAPSAGNSQPWSLLLTHRGDPTHGRLVQRLAKSSRRWAPEAALLAVTAAYRFVDDDMPYSEFADYDLGQAVAHLTIQAEALGLATHQFRAFDLDGLTRDLAVRQGWAIVSMIAIGHAPTPSAQEQRQERTRRTAQDVREAAWGGLQA